MGLIDWSNALIAAPMLELARIAEYGGLSPAFAAGTDESNNLTGRWSACWGEVTLRANAKTTPTTSNRRFDACQEVVRKRPFPRTRLVSLWTPGKLQFFGAKHLQKLCAVSHPSASFQRTRRRNTLIGYARVSTGDQNVDLRRDALTPAGC